jgi:hypothetical protein
VVVKVVQVDPRLKVLVVMVDLAVVVELIMGV